ncbi:hypothetical protein [Limosilactobacillus sp.]|jgi:hypothetical protein|uniref:hypothetical protein n=1 Tax=Limosilactobacillus sp. TaxID=2773925 RepID=UPI00359FC60F
MQNPFGNNDNNDQNPFNLNNLPLPPNYAKIVNGQGDIRIAKVGFSWTTLWFGPLPALFRGDYYNFILMIVLDMDYALVALFFGWTWMVQFPWPSIFFGFFYNMMYFKHLFNKGYHPADQRSRELLIRLRYWKEK